ncbi:MAG: helix-turn-helix domain-containing protein [Chitinivibrionales bacterium]|nr:helix-turn-helix domain-containing protein [Chitinivibrionales bacterium]
MQSEPVEKIIKVLECLNNHHADSISLHDLARVTHIPKATLLRIVSSLMQHGYVTRDAQRKYLSNVSLSRILPVSGSHLERLRVSLHSLLERTRQAVEVLVVRDAALYWYEKIDHPELSIRLIARPGFKRKIYELDSPVRLYMKTIGRGRIEKLYDTSGFYMTGCDYRKVSWDTAWRIIDEADVNNVAYDEQGNSNGVRRFAALVSLQPGEMSYLLSVAEPAIHRNNEHEHIEMISKILLEEKRKLESVQ